jgi:hypothetical protein
MESTATLHAHFKQARDHHYIPVFYLKQWCELDKKLVEYTVKHGHFIAKPVGPKGTGFQTDLYAFPELPPETAQHMEDEFLKAVDNTASLALQKLLTEDHHWTSKLRSGWSRFLISLIIRHPDIMRELRAGAVACWKRTGPSSQARYEELKEPYLPPTFDEYVSSVDPLIPIKVALNAIIKAFDSQRLGTQINRMHWAVIDLSKASHQLVTSERPAQYQNLARETGFIAVPIGPTKLFITANSPQSISSVRAKKSEHVVKEVNRGVVSRARRFVFAHDQSQADFVKKYIHKNMEPAPLFPSLLT